MGGGEGFLLTQNGLLLVAPAHELGEIRSSTGRYVRSPWCHVCSANQPGSSPACGSNRSSERTGDIAVLHLAVQVGDVGVVGEEGHDRLAVGAERIGAEPGDHAANDLEVGGLVDRDAKVGPLGPVWARDGRTREPVGAPIHEEGHVFTFVVGRGLPSRRLQHRPTHDLDVEPTRVAAVEAGRHVVDVE